VLRGKAARLEVKLNINLVITGAFAARVALDARGAIKINLHRVGAGVARTALILAVEGLLRDNGAARADVKVKIKIELGITLALRTAVDLRININIDVHVKIALGLTVFLGVFPGIVGIIAHDGSFVKGKVFFLKIL